MHLPCALLSSDRHVALSDPLLLRLSSYKNALNVRTRTSRSASKRRANRQRCLHFLQLKITASHHHPVTTVVPRTPTDTDDQRNYRECNRRANEEESND